VVGIKAQGEAFFSRMIAGVLDGDAVVNGPGDAEVVAGLDAVEGADAFGGGMEGLVDQEGADDCGVEKDEGEGEVVEEAGVWH
jgi:hypothetical protein